MRLEICVELGTLLLSLHPLPPSPSSPALALQRDSAEMCPELGDSCQLMEQNPEVISSCSQVRGTVMWRHQEPNRSNNEVLRSPRTQLPTAPQIFGPW